MIRCRHMQYLIRFSDLLHAFQDKENIIVPVMFSWGKNDLSIFIYPARYREFESNNSLECCHEVRFGKQKVHANKVYAGMERQINCTRACKLSGLLVSGLPCPSL